MTVLFNSGYGVIKRTIPDSTRLFLSVSTKLRIFQSFTHRSVLLILVSIYALLLTACGGGGNPGVVDLSQTDSTNSHTDNRRGTNCLQSDCHTSGGAGTVVFITAGTSISATNGFVEYYADLARTDLRARLPVDAYGNFYTVTAIDILTPNMSGFSLGAYMTIVMPNGSTRNMSGIVSHTTAGCNSCHRSGGSRSPL